jgi:uncharacterized phage protein gp47/JayE
MPAPYGLTPTGFVAKTLTEIKTDLEAVYRATYGAGANLIPESNMGQEIAIISERLAELWDLLGAVVAAVSPDGATGVQLDNVCALTGTVRDPPVKSRVYATLNGTAATLVEAGRLFSTTAHVQFETLADVTLTGSPVTGVECRAVEAGPLPAYSGTLTVIDTPVDGLTSVTNPADHFVLGAELEKDPPLKIRREQELRAQGNAAVEAIRQKVLAVDNVLQVYVFENDTDDTDGDGLPPHSIEVVVNGGDADEIRAAIYAAKGGGIYTHGTTSGTLVDSQGFTKTVRFTRPTTVPIYVVLHDVTYDADEYPIDGDDQIKAAIVAYGLERYQIGTDVHGSPLSAQAFSIPGVTDVGSFGVGTAPAPVAASVVITARQLAVLDTSRVSINPP